MPKNKKTKNSITKKPRKKLNEPLKIMVNTLRISGSVMVGEHCFEGGHTVPIYEVTTIHALNQLIGYAKFINKAYGDVYYRGECKLHKTLTPSLYRNRVSTSCAENLNELISTISNDYKMKHQLKFDFVDIESTNATIEGMLQHYGIKTRFIDVVDNHWVALWMGLNSNQKIKQIETYNHYSQRSIPLVDFANGKNCAEEDLFQYILLVAVPGNSKRVNNGIYISDDFMKIDLRQALPSIFLRPHAQHGLVIRKRPHSGDVKQYDMSNSVIGILKIRIDKSSEWIGGGELLTQENLFPAPAYDHGYDILLSRDDIFNGADYKIARYV